MSDSHALHQHESDNRDVLGFWLYIMTDCLLFATLFATFFVLHHPGAYGPSFKPFVDLKYVFIESMCLLFSNFTFGMAVLAQYKQKMVWFMVFMVATLILGGCFVGMEINEFHHLALEGYSWHVSGAASSFFTLVGTHGLHVTFGLIWILSLVIQVALFGFNPSIKRRIVYLGIFWNFLEIVWIFVYTMVYLRGVL